jgi:hypothetical protein
VGINTASLPSGWRDRLVALESPRTTPARGLCLEPHDLVASKLAAWRAKDRDYARALLEAGLISKATLLDRMRLLEGVPKGKKRLIRDWLLGVGGV